MNTVNVSRSQDQTSTSAVPGPNCSSEITQTADKTTMTSLQHVSTCSLPAVSGQFTPPAIIPLLSWPPTLQDTAGWIFSHSCCNLQHFQERCRRSRQLFITYRFISTRLWSCFCLCTTCKRSLASQGSRCDSLSHSLTRYCHVHPTSHEAQQCNYWLDIFICSN